MDYITNCEFSNPKDYQGNPPATSTDFWNYQELNCSSTDDTVELIENASTSTFFYISRFLSYGDILIIIFLMLFLVFGIMKFITNFIIPKRINFKR